MKHLQVCLPSRLVDAVSNRLSTLGVSALDVTPAADEIRLTAYCPEGRERLVLEAAQAYVEELAPRVGVSPVPHFELADVSPDWETNWARLLPPAHLLPGLVLVAEGVPYEVSDGERLLHLEPGLYFGFGEHPTTQMMSEWLARHAPQRTVLDVGCGTGVLSFVAAFVGASAVLGVDIDEPSVASAVRNARNNGLDGVCTFSSQPLQTVGGRFDLVVANIDAKTLSHLATDLVRSVSDNGALALTGVLDEQAQDVVAAYLQAGVALEVVDERQGWVLLALRVRNHS